MMIDRGCYAEQATFTYLLPEKLLPETNWGPSSVLNEYGTPNWANIGLIASIIYALVVDFRTVGPRVSLLKFRAARQY